MPLFFVCYANRIMRICFCFSPNNALMFSTSRSVGEYLLSWTYLTFKVVGWDLYSAGTMQNTMMLPSSHRCPILSHLVFQSLFFGLKKKTKLHELWKKLKCASRKNKMIKTDTMITSVKSMNCWIETLQTDFTFCTVEKKTCFHYV